MSEISEIDELLESLNSGIVYVIEATHRRVRMNLVKGGAGTTEMDEGVDLAILTRSRYADFVLLPEKPSVDIIDRIAEMPTNYAPDHPYFIQRSWSQWPTRSLMEITGLTIHHTCSHSPLATAQWITKSQANGGKGYPTTQYHYWISQADSCPIYHLVDDSLQVWHDQTGAFPTALSIGMAGRLHEVRPPDEQIEAVARLVAWLMREYNIPEEEVQGHADRYSGTVCPGWYDGGIAAPSGVWKRDFCIAAREAVEALA